ncbi:MAG: tRNA (adenosine(37)-N6)-threonylcarbamoyltransferase complex transferase subunit TsaD [Rhodospirillaceae bacterium]|nr:tRNA (adenosine(37)-N6)-threonylcarbamoyltransferase complex transferase subunit TsaD [Alphaproteobacteria bacterium]MBR71837.1 tRNA (adenosine(37)-N6)-threonylcarbamoyltransferase complex transferase subunit TsaD [Rhodospirillaceae bacterium]
MIVLGIESSCDETAAAVVNSQGKILANVLRSQITDHEFYGGVVPEIAARSHLDHLDKIISSAMKQADISFDELDGVAATAGPGLIGALMVGLMTGKAIAATNQKPLIALNHLEGHALSPRLVDQEVSFPYLLLLVSGGHCQLLIVQGVGKYKRLGTTIDDAPGEAFDKVSKLLGLGYPGGPAIEKAANRGNPRKYKLPRPLVGRDGCDFSFSGLKTAVFHLIQKIGDTELRLDKQHKYDIAASFQSAVSEVIRDRTESALREYRKLNLKQENLVVAGGVAANSQLRENLEDMAQKLKIRLSIPHPSLCTDNGAMIAWGGIERLKLGLIDGYEFAPRARWPLDPNAGRPPGMGLPGKLGMKA